jgi:hypothetical protein
MSAHPPPIPPTQRSPKGSDPDVDSGSRDKIKDWPPSTGQRGDAGNTKQNTTNKGLQQDR